MNEENQNKESPTNFEEKTVQEADANRTETPDHDKKQNYAENAEASTFVDHTVAPDLETQYQQAINETEEWRERALRAIAEMENNRRRLEKDKEEYARYAHAGLIKALLPVIDNLSRAIQASGENTQDPEFGENLRKGVEMVAEDFSSIFAQHHVRLIKPEKGDPFDPQLHEAMTETRDENLPPSSIALVLEPGYQLHDRLLRPCRVAVNARDIHTKGQTVDVKS